MARPRSETARLKVIEAALALFAERGLDATSMDAISEQSGVSKATLYKHWPNKTALTLEALSHLFGADQPIPVADTGDLRADLAARLSHQPAPDRRKLRDRIMPHVIAYASRDADFGKAWRAQAMTPIIRTLSDWIKREQTRGTLRQDVDLEVAMAMLIGPLTFRNIFHRTEPGKRKPYAPGLENQIAKAFLLLYGVKT